MKEQLKLRTAYKLLQSHKILGELSVSNDRDRMRMETAQNMIFENAYAILDSIEPNIEQIIKGETYTYTLKESVQDNKEENNSISDDYCCESGGKGGKGDYLWDLMYGKPD